MDECQVRKCTECGEGFSVGKRVRDLTRLGITPTKDELKVCSDCAAKAKQSDKEEPEAKHSL